MANMSYIIFFCYTIFNTQAKTTQFVQKEPNNIVLKDNSDLKVDFDLSDDNYEKSGKRYAEHLSTMEDNLFKEFNEIASREYKRAMENFRADVRENYNGTTTQKSFMMVNSSRISTTSHVRLSRTRKSNTTNEKVEYDYLVSDTDVKGDARTNAYSSFEIQQRGLKLLDSINKRRSFGTSQKHMDKQLGSVSINVIKRCFEEFYRKQNYKSLTKHAWKIATIWVVVCLAITLPLWFTRGWCSCCLCCKFFRPQETIQEAKNYLLLNPPGILITKRGGIVHYQPTEREKECYEEFSHFLRIL